MKEHKLADLLVRGMQPFFTATPAEIIKEVSKGIVLGEYKVFVIDFKAFCILRMPQNPLDIPQVLHFYSEGTALDRHSLVSRVLDFVKEKGYTKLRAVNGSEASDEIWKRAFKHKGWEIKPVKTVFDFEVMT